MTPKPLAVFTAHFPDDQVEDERDIVLLGGRNVALAIRRLASDSGCAVSGLDYDTLKGWGFEATFRGEVFGCMTTSFYPKYFFDIGKQDQHKRETYAEFWRVIDHALRDDGRFSKVEWYLREEAPDPWEDESEASEPPDPAAIAAAAKERRAQYRRRQNENLAKGFGCWLTAIALVVAMFGLIGIVGGAAKLLAGGHGGGLIANGLLVLLAGGLGFWLFGYVWTGKARKPPDSAG